LPAGTRAGQHHLVDLTLTHLRQLADVAAGMYKVVSRHGLRRITSEFVEAVEYRTKLGQRVEGAMGSLWKFEALFLSDQPPTKPSSSSRRMRFRRGPIRTARFFPDAGKTGSRHRAACATTLALEAGKVAVTDVDDIGGQRGGFLKLTVILTVC
jgi:hypothetical protein